MKTSLNDLTREAHGLLVQRLKSFYDLLVFISSEVGKTGFFFK